MPEFKKNRITLDRETNEHTKRFKRSLNKVKWARALMQIFWTAGPVTGLGLIGGYYIAYGVMPSYQLLIYFISFTVFSGLIGLVAKVFYDGTRGHLKEQGEHDILKVIDKLGDLILEARDNVIQGFEDEARTRGAALLLLRRVDLTPYEINIAFTDLTGNREIGEIMGRIHSYRKAGLQTKVRELYMDHKPQIDKVVEEIAKNYPDAAHELKQWFSGNRIGALKYGVSREPLFLQRVMSAIEHSNPYLMTARDVEEVMILAFELINGREIPTLTFAYSGKWKFARALDDMEKKRSMYRVAQAKVGNRLRAIAAYLVETGFVASEELPETLTMDQLAGRVSIIMDQLADEVQKTLKDENIPLRVTENLVEILDTCIELYEMAYQGYKETGKWHTRLIEASKKWEKITREADSDAGELQIEAGKKGILIEEKIIALNEEARLEVCRHLSWYFRRKDSKNSSHTQYSSLDNKGPMAARLLAIEIALALEPHVKLSKPEIQRNINATRAIYLGGLSHEMSAVQKEELGRRMAKEVDNTLGKAAEQLADTLVRQYNVELTEEAKEFLHYNYTAGTEALEKLSKQKMMFNLVSSNLKDRPPVVDLPKPYWIKTRSLAKKALSKTKRK